MKLALATLAAVATAEPIPDTNSQFVAFNQGAREAKQEIAAGVRSDGNALLISQMLEFYLIQVHGITPDKVEMMLSYGCYCQLLTNRRVGLDEPVDEFDAICKKYQMCTQCVTNDEKGNTVNNGGEQVECNWESGRYEISFLAGQVRVDCESNIGNCGTNLCKCDEELAWELAENQDLFKAANSALRGFEFADECRAKPPCENCGPGGNRGELQCCGEFPARIPYHDQNGGRDCCVDKVYSTEDKKCCNNGSLAAINGQC